MYVLRGHVSWDCIGYLEISRREGLQGTLRGLHVRSHTFLKASSKGRFDPASQVSGQLLRPYGTRDYILVPVFSIL